MASAPTYAYANASIPTAKTQIVGPSTAKRQIRKLTFINNSGGDLTVNLWIDTSGIIETLFLPTKTIANLQTWSCFDIEGHVLEPNGTMSVQASGNNLAMNVSTITVTT